ncbi:unnamed protein product [Toxocara canis]|nr:unnamed protein product [Toxocara canis]
MGCRLSRSESDMELERNALNACSNEQQRVESQQHTDNHHNKAASNSPVSNGQSAPSRVDTASPLNQKMSPQPARPTNSGERSPVNVMMCTKPIGQVESASQADFFKMLDEKIAHGVGDFPDSDVED